MCTYMQSVGVQPHTHLIKVFTALLGGLKLHIDQHLDTLSKFMTDMDHTGRPSPSPIPAIQEMTSLLLACMLYLAPAVILCKVPDY